MIPFWDDLLIFTGLWSILNLFMAYFSLRYYMDRNQIARNDIRTFFENLSTPVRWGINFAIWFLTDTHPLDGQSRWGKSWLSFMLVKLMFSLGAIFPIVVFSLDMMEANTTAEMISAGAGLIFAVNLFIRAWFFGHKLKDMQAAASDMESEGK